MSKWSEFYAGRLNSKYWGYFLEKYKPLIDFIELKRKDCGDIAFMLEEACGMGNVTKALLERSKGGESFAVSDLCPEMLELAVRNLAPMGLRQVTFYRDNMMDSTEEADVIFSHGSLEHFDDTQIKHIINSQKHRASHVIHYVPSELYKKPSFGDERLMSPTQWIDIVQPDDIIEFNKGYDLILYWDSREDIKTDNLK